MSDGYIGELYGVKIITPEDKLRIALRKLDRLKGYMDPNMPLTSTVMVDIEEVVGLFSIIKEQEKTEA